MKWVVVIVSISVIAIGAVVATITVGAQTFDGTVVDDHYERGLSFDEDIELRQKSGLDPQVLNGALEVGDNELLLSLGGSDSAERPDLLVTLTRPHTRAQDQRLELAHDPQSGHYRGALTLPEPGHWELLVQVDVDGKSVRFRRALDVTP